MVSFDAFIVQHYERSVNTERSVSAILILACSLGLDCQIQALTAGFGNPAGAKREK
jgi:hypothetical protein